MKVVWKFPRFRENHAPLPGNGETAFDCRLSFDTVRVKSGEFCILQKGDVWLVILSSGLLALLGHVGIGAVEGRMPGLTPGGHVAISQHPSAKAKGLGQMGTTS